MKDTIVIDPPGFSQRGAWQECSEYVEECGGLANDEGEVNWRAAFGADPGCCSCPSCGTYYWAWGRVQKCVDCGFEYQTDWWPAYVDGCRDGRLISGLHTCPDPKFHSRMVEFAQRRFEQRKDHPYYRWGFDHPVVEEWFHHDKIDWRFVFSTQGADMYTPSERVSAQLKKTFTYCRPQGNQPQRYERLRDEAGKLAHLIACNTPESREQSLALTKLEEVVMFANAAIARNEEWDGNAMKSPLQITVEK